MEADERAKVSVCLCVIRNISRYSHEMLRDYQHLSFRGMEIASENLTLKQPAESLPIDR